MTKLDSSGLYKNDGWDAQEYELPMGDVILVGVPAAFSLLVAQIDTCRSLQKTLKNYPNTKLYLYQWTQVML